MQAIEKKDDAFNALKNEKENLTTILMSSKANYLGDLLEAERKIKRLENELNEIKSFIFHDVLVANETILTSIRQKYGDASKKIFESTAVSASCASESAMSVDNNPTPVALTDAQIDTTPAAVPAEIPTIEAQQSSAEGKLAKDLRSEVIEITDDEHIDAAAADANLLKRFPCEKCSRSFSTMALRFRHVSKVHGDEQNDEEDQEQDQQLVENVVAVKKPLKRLVKKPSKKKCRAAIRILEEQGLFEGLLEYIQNNQWCSHLSPDIIQEYKSDTFNLKSVRSPYFHYRNQCFILLNSRDIFHFFLLEFRNELC